MRNVECEGHGFVSDSFQNQTKRKCDFCIDNTLVTTGRYNWFTTLICKFVWWYCLCVCEGGGGYKNHDFTILLKVGALCKCFSRPIAWVHAYPHICRSFQTNRPGGFNGWTGGYGMSVIIKPSSTTVNLPMFPAEWNLIRLADVGIQGFSPRYSSSSPFLSKNRFKLRKNRRVTHTIACISRGAYHEGHYNGVLLYFDTFTYTCICNT